MPRTERLLGIPSGLDQIPEVHRVAQGIVAHLPVTQAEMVHQPFQAIASKAWNQRKSMKHGSVKKKIDN